MRVRRLTGFRGGARRSAVIATGLSALLVSAVGLSVSTGIASGEPSALPDWAPRATAKITPGVQMYTKGAQCTGNFVFTDASGMVYVGYAAHCAGLGEATNTNGCKAGTRPVGTDVVFRKGGSLLGEGKRIGGGKLAYSSWATMQENKEKGGNVCAYNDLALVRVDADTARKVNPTVPFFGGPNGLSKTLPTSGGLLYSIGNSSLRGGLEVLRPKVGVSLGADGGGGWSQSGYTVSPGVPGDSGSGFMDVNGNAVGVLSTLSLAPLPASNGIGSLRNELEYAKRHSGIKGLRLVKGEVPFAPLS